MLNRLSYRISLTLFVAVMLFSPLLLWYYPKIQRQQLYDSNQRELRNIAFATALGVGTALEDENFAAIQKSIDFTKNQEDFDFVAIVQVDTNQNTTGKPEITKQLFQVYPKERNIDPEIQTGTTLIVERGQFFSSVLSGEIIVGFKTTGIQKRITETRRVFYIWGIVSLVIFVLLAFLLSRAILNPLKTLDLATQRVGRGDREPIGKTNALWEMQQFIGSFNQMLVTLKATEEDLDRKSREVRDSILAARGLQQSVLPSLSEIEKHFEETLIIYKPKNVVGGDFYWIHEAGDLLIFAIGDCTGHGIPGALSFMSIVGTLRQIVLGDKIYSPNAVLTKINNALLAEQITASKQGVIYYGVDIGIGAINSKTGELTYSGASRPLLIIRDNALTELPVARYTLGVITKELEFSNASFMLKAGDCVYSFSDGFPDQFGGGEKWKKFMTKNLKQLILTNHQLPFVKQKELFESTFETWKGNYEQTDDLTLIGFKIK
jgi:serine phosphatase RsbU (regulator of sigma subunit)